MFVPLWPTKRISTWQLLLLIENGVSADTTPALQVGFGETLHTQVFQVPNEDRQKRETAG